MRRPRFVLTAASFVSILLLAIGTSPASATVTSSVFVPSSSPTLANYPNQSVVDPSGNLWVASNDNPATMVTRIAPDGTATIAWRSNTTPLPSENTACPDRRNYGIAYASGRIYWTCSTAAVYSISATASLPVSTADIRLELNITTGFGAAHATAVAVTAAGDIFVDDWDHTRLFVHRAGTAVTAATEILLPWPTGWPWPMSLGPDGNLYFGFDDTSGGHDLVYKVDVVGGTFATSVYWTDPLTTSVISGIAFFPGSMTMAIVDNDAATGLRAVVAAGNGTGTLAAAPLLAGDPLLASASGLAFAPSGSIAYVTVSDANTLHAVTKVSGLSDPQPTPPQPPSPSPSTTATTPTTSTGSPSDPVVPAFTG